MRDEDIEFVSEGVRVRGVLRWPDVPPDSPPPLVLQGPNWGLRGSPVADLYHADLAAAGFAVLTLDHRGWGQSEGERGWLRPAQQREDLHNAITYAQTRGDLDTDRISLWGLGITGGNAVVAAADDERIAAVVLQSPIADVGAWVREMYADRDFDAFAARLAADAAERVAGGEGDYMDPSVEFMGSPAERKGAKMLQVGRSMRLGSAVHLMRLRPVDVVHRLAPRPLLIISVPEDRVTGEHHALALFEAARAPKQLLRLHDVSHYEQYRVARELHVAPWVAWLNEHDCGPGTDPGDFGREPTPATGSDGRAPYVTTLRRAAPSPGSDHSSTGPR